MRVIMNVLAIAICQGVIRLDFSKNLHGKLPFLCPKTIKSHNFAPFRRFDGTLLSYVRLSTRLRKNPSRTPKIHQNSDFLGEFCSVQRTLSLRGAKRRGNLPEGNKRLILAMT